MRKVLLAIVTLCLCAMFGATVSAFHVRGDDMAPSIQADDWVWVVPWGEPHPGDVVVLSDPLDSQQRVLRRVLAVAGQTITYDADSIRVNKKRLRKQAMGDDDPYLVAKETLWAKKPEKGHSWLTRLVAYPATHWRADPVTVPDGHLYLLADDRDAAIDSRWWGTLPVEAVEGIVRFRWGPATTWRTEMEWLVGTAPIRD